MFSVRFIVSQVPFILSLILIGFIFTKVLFKEEKNISVIAVSKKGTKLMTDSDRYLRDLERVNFLKEFVSYYFNFNNDENSPMYFKRRLSKATPLLTKSFWQEKEKDQYEKTKAMIEKIDYEERAKITKIFKCEESDIRLNLCETENVWSVFLDVEIRKNGSLFKKKGHLKVFLKEVERQATEEGKWGLKIYDLKKNLI